MVNLSLYKSAERIAKKLKEYFKDSSNKKFLENVIYHELTQRQDPVHRDKSLIAFKNKENREGYNRVKEWLSKSANILGWRSTDDGAWFQLNKPYSGIKEKGNYKFYISIDISDLKTINESLIKLQKLMVMLNDSQTKGSLSFKIPSNIGVFLNHYDNIVIHFNNILDKDNIKSAIDSVDFKTLNRRDFGRSDFGRDTGEEDESDSVAVARQIVRNFDANKTLLATHLDKPEDTMDYKIGLSAIASIIERISLNASHRNITSKLIRLEDLLQKKGIYNRQLSKLIDKII